MAKQPSNTETFSNIGAIMSTNVIVLSKDTTLAEAARLLTLHRIGAVVVVDKKKLCGILSERDYVTKVAYKNKQVLKTKVGQVMTRKVLTARPHEPLTKVLTLMHKNHIRHIPVVDHRGFPIGIVSMRDLMYKVEEHLRNLVRKRTEEVRIDSLTGLYNVRFFNDYLDAEIARSVRRGGNFTLLFMDLDYFKRLNDTLGHAKGNEVLKEFSKIINPNVKSKTRKFSLRRSDISVRLGGDEFGLILTDTNWHGALICAERLRQATEEHVTRIIPKKYKMSVTVSIGIAEYPTHAKKREDILERADRALYQAKRNGRNKVCVYQQ